jgi:hypothetical protein
MHLIGKYSFVTHFSCSIYMLRGKSQCCAETKKETEFVETSHKGFMKSLPFWKNYNLSLCYDQKQNPKISNRNVHCPRLKRAGVKIDGRYHADLNFSFKGIGHWKLVCPHHTIRLFSFKFWNICSVVFQIFAYTSDLPIDFSCKDRAGLCSSNILHLYLDSY